MLTGFDDDPSVLWKKLTAPSNFGSTENRTCSLKFEENFDICARRVEQHVARGKIPNIRVNFFGI